MEAKVVFPLFATTILAVLLSHAESIADQTILMPQSGVGGRLSAGVTAGVNCLSWRLNVEVDNIQGWTLVPKTCTIYIGNYMTKQQYDVDSKVATDAAYDYAKSLTLVGDGKDAWVFDIDQTALSLIDYYARPDVQFGSIAYNDTKFEEWLTGGTAPANRRVLKLYTELLDLRFKIVFISGTKENQRKVREANLINAGYHTWEKVMLKKDSEKGTTAAVYKVKKRTELVGEGYRIWGNLGDQWSDLSEPNAGNRTFKLPNPMFYIA